MFEPRDVSVLKRNLVAERPESVEQLLVLTSSYAPELYEVAVGITSAFREKQRLPPALFAEMRDLYGRVVEGVGERAKDKVTEGRFEDAFRECERFVLSLDDRELRNEILIQKGRWNDLRAQERMGVAEEASRSRLRKHMLETIDAISSRAAEMPPAPAVSAEPSVAAGRDEIPKAAAEHAIIGGERDVVLRCEDLRKRYEGSSIDALSGVTLDITRGRILGVVGLNGAGKSSLLSILAGELAPDAGRVVWGELRRADIALVPQKGEPWAGRLVEHLRLHAAYFGHTGVKNDEILERTLTLLNLQPYANHRYGEMSAGYQARCDLARALVSVPQVLILDEPLASLDPVAQYEFLAVLHANSRFLRRRLPVVISSQHIDVVESFADDMLVLRDGRPLYCGPTAEIGVDRDENVFEVRCPLTAPELLSCLRALEPRSIRQRADSNLAAAGGLYEVRVPVSAGARDVLGALHARDVQIGYFADLSRSSLAQLLKERGPREAPPGRLV